MKTGIFEGRLQVNLEMPQKDFALDAKRPKNDILLFLKLSYYMKFTILRL